MAVESLSIKERIERQLKTNLATISGIGSVERWQANGQPHRQDLTCYVVPDDEIYEGGEQESGLYVVRLPIEIALLQRQAKDDTEDSGFKHNRWLKLLHQKVMADTNLTETTTNALLALDIQVTGTSNPISETGQPEFYTILEIEVTYEINRENPTLNPHVAAVAGGTV